MRRTSGKEVHSAAFSARIEAVEALRTRGTQSGSDATRLRGVADKVRLVSDSFGQAPNAAVYAAFADLLQIVALLGEWRSAVLNAGVDANRFLTAAKERASAWLTSNGANSALTAMGGIARDVGSVQAVADVMTFAEKLSKVPLPIGMYEMPIRSSLRIPTFGETEDEEVKARPVELAVAFIRFSIDGKPLDEVHYVTPGEAHDMDVEVRVSRWPKYATELILEPVTVEPAGTYHLPKFTMEAPLGEVGPFRLTSQGRVMLMVPNHIHARPFEFKYAARFVPTGTEQAVEIVGQRTLLLEGVDIARRPLTGYLSIDRKLIEIRNTLRIVPHVDQKELADALTVAFALGNYAGQIIQANLVKGVIDEDEFQRRLGTVLRGWPAIGSELEEHPHAAGGITDLSFHGIRIELKVESKKQLTLADCSRFEGQTVSYAVGSGKHIGVLCVLDCSGKEKPAFPPEDGIQVIAAQQADGTPVYVIVFLLQGNLAKPSDFSR